MSAEIISIRKEISNIANQEEVSFSAQIVLNLLKLSEMVRFIEGDNSLLSQ